MYYNESMLSKEEVIKIAKLANIKLSESEIEKFQKQLSNILDYVKKLNALDTKNVEPTFHAVGQLKNRFQDPARSFDSVLTQQSVLANAKEKNTSHIITKGVL